MRRVSNDGADQRHRRLMSTSTSTLASNRISCDPRAAATTTTKSQMISPYSRLDIRRGSISTIATAAFACGTTTSQLSSSTTLVREDKLIRTTAAATTLITATDNLRMSNIIGFPTIHGIVRIQRKRQQQSAQFMHCSYMMMMIIFMIGAIIGCSIGTAFGASVLDTTQHSLSPPLAPGWLINHASSNPMPHNYLLSVWLNSITSSSTSGGAATTGNGAKISGDAQAAMANIDPDIAERLREGLTHNHASNRIDLELATRAWRLMRVKTQQYAIQQVHQMRPIVDHLMASANVSNECRKSVEHVLDNLVAMKLWAFKLWNSWGDFPSTGIMEGSLTNMGSYYGCVDLNDGLSVDAKRQVVDQIGQGQYCTISYQPLVPRRPRYHNILTPISGLANATANDELLHQLAAKAQYFYYTKLRTSICVPSKCTQDDVASMATLVGSSALLQTTDVKCLKREIEIINSKQWVAIIILAVLASLSLLGTFMHLVGIESWGQQRTWMPSLVARFLSAMSHFSMVRNARRLFDTSNSSQDITCVHGLRFWTITWIIFGHTMQYTEWAGFGRSFIIENNLVAFALQPFLNATFSVDTFFLISGVLTTYVTWSMTKGDIRRFNKMAYIVSRYLRLTPQVMLITLFFFILPLMGDGPYWRGLIDGASENCQNNWWINALYLQAFYKSDQICNLVTWWLSIEMFYHLASVVAVTMLLRSKAKGMLITLAMGAGFTMVSFYLHYINEYPPNMLPTLPQRYEIWDSIVRKYFWTPYPHAASYFTGLALGYVLYTKSIKKLTNAQVRNGWLAFVVTYCAILFGTYQWNNASPYTRLGAAFYYNTSQVMWALATAWAILACVIGRGGFVNRFLSAPVWIPLGRATYMTYLAHMTVVMAFPASMNQLIEPSYHMFLYIFVSNLVLSYMLGITLTIVYESPLLHLQKLALTALLVRGEPVKSNADEKDPSKTAALIGSSPAPSPGSTISSSSNNNNNNTTQTITSNNNNSDTTIDALNNDAVVVNGQLKANLALNMSLERDAHRYSSKSTSDGAPNRNRSSISNRANGKGEPLV